MGAAVVDLLVAGAMFGVSLIVAILLFVAGGALPVTAGVL
jgi:hypothetical protein